MIAQVTALGEPAAFAFSAVLSVSVHHVPLVSSTKTAAALYPRLVQTQQRSHLRPQARTVKRMKTMLRQMRPQAQTGEMRQQVQMRPQVQEVKTMETKMRRQAQTGEMMLRQMMQMRRQAQTGEMMLRQMMLRVQIVGALLMLGSGKRMGMKMMLQAQTGEMMLRRQVQMGMMMTTKTRA